MLPVIDFIHTNRDRYVEELKQYLARVLATAGHAVLDLGTHDTEPVDYPDIAAAAAGAVVEGRAARAAYETGRKSRHTHLRPA